MTARKRKPKRWSQHVTQNSDAMDIKKGALASGNPRQVAQSLKRSAERSRRRKAGPFQSAMSMLNFYINRAGRKLPQRQRTRLQRAKDELRALFGRPRKKA